MTFEEVLSKEFEIKNGKIYLRNGDYTWFDARRLGFGEPIEYYIDGPGVYSRYFIKQDAYKDWYIYDHHNSYTPIKKLKHLGGENWRSWF